jgi:hypothetical protein
MILENVGDRYNKYHTEGRVTFFLSEPDIAEEEARFLIIKVLDQAIKDYILFQNPTNSSEQESLESAVAFLFDDDYLIDWGEWELSPAEALELVDLDMDWVREQAKKKLRSK